MNTKGEIKEFQEACDELRCHMKDKCSAYKGYVYDVWGEGIETPKECVRFSETDLPFN